MVLLNGFMKTTTKHDHFRLVFALHTPLDWGREAGRLLQGSGQRALVKKIFYFLGPQRNMETFLGVLTAKF